MNTKYSIMIIVKTPELAIPVIESIKPYEATVVSNVTGSFSKCINEAVIRSKNEVIIICSHKVRPTKANIDQMLKYINDGYGLVCMYRFAFFGLNRDLVRQLGFWDERYIGGGFDDNDYIIRMNEAGVSYIFEQSITYIPSKSLWHYALARPHFIKKWEFSKDKDGKPLIKRLLPEEPYKYDIGPTTFQKFKPRSETIQKVGNEKWQSYRTAKFI